MKTLGTMLCITILSIWIVSTDSKKLISINNESITIDSLNQIIDSVSLVNCQLDSLNRSNNIRIGMLQQMIEKEYEETYTEIYE